LTVRIEAVASLSAVRAEWAELAESSRNIFATWEFADTWWRHFGQGRRLATYICRRDGEAVALLPLYTWRERPVRVARFVGGPDGDELGPIGQDRDEAFADAVATVLDDAGIDLLLAEHIPRSLGWNRLPGARTLRSEASPVVQFDGVDWDTYFAGRSANFRSVVRRSERKAAERGLRFRLSDAETLDRDLDALFRLHGARWNGRTEFAGRAQFHRAFARVAEGRGWLRLWLVEDGDRPVAAWYGFRFQGIESYYQAGRDPAWDEYRLGLLLLVHSIRSAIADGMDEYRFLRGDEPYKHRFTDLDPGVESIAVARTRRGAAALSVGASALAARRRIRALARRRQ
jgi:CelD/BcsL family acetyltransferase involved in cellulose biosynthesis